MSSVGEMPSEVMEALRRGWTVLTANQRTARTLRQGYNSQLRAAGESGWTPPAVFAWDTWLGVLWRSLVVDGSVSELLLNAHQEHVVWREILQADTQLASSLRSVDSMADLAASGWALLNRFRARRELRRFGETADSRAFAGWVAEFERRCARGGYLSRARLPETLERAFEAGELVAQGGLLLVGFDRKSRDQDGLLAAAERAGLAVEEFAAEDLGYTRILAEAGSEQLELETCARWLREFLRVRPEARTAVIVPGLGDLRSRIHRTFREILAPELEDITAGTDCGPYEFSLGTTLGSSALVRTALDLLAWAAGPLPIESVSRILLSPSFAEGKEYVARAEFDAFALRQQKLLLPEISAAELWKLAIGWKERGRIEALTKHLWSAQRLLEDLKQNVGDRSHAAWCVVFQQILEVFGWASGQAEGSVEFQTRRRWAGLLDELAGLDFEESTLSYAQALDELRRMADGTVFAPESHDAPVQVMGPLEAAGSRFDAVWFLRTGDLSWPAGANAHPIIPLRLQRELGMPGADPALEMELARKIVGRLATSARTIVFSYAPATADSHQRPSAALEGLELQRVDVEALVTPEAARLPVTVESFADETPIPTLPDRVARGGSQILQLQAACAFRAFAEKRLNSAALGVSDAGLDPKERGKLVHAVLEEVWKELENQNALKALGQDSRRELLSRCIADALRKHTEGASGWELAYLEAEQARLLKLLGAWLDVELERPAFQVLSHEENVQDLALGPLRVDVRLDRVDILMKNGKPAGEIVVDYKTGYVTPADWKGERPDEPQVPLYALVRDPGSLAGVAFARLRPGSGMKLVGLQAAKDVLFSKGRTHDIAAQVEDWRDVLTRLAEEFSAGRAPVDPKQYPTTCRYCEQRVLCRLDPRALDAESLEDMADPEGQDAEAESA